MKKETEFSMVSNPLLRLYMIYTNDVALIVILFFVLLTLGGVVFTDQTVRFSLNLFVGLILLILLLWERRSGHKKYLIENCEVNLDTKTLKFKTITSDTSIVWELSQTKYKAGRPVCQPRPTTPWLTTILFCSARCGAAFPHPL